ncbi:MAG: hypothetical protein MJZ16_06450, partial [Bacteroidales bacterium]|nr:hypothetical protein [Bacteroidales bacterium]
MDISLFTPKFTLVPSNFFDPLAARNLLGGVVKLRESDRVEYVNIPSMGATLVYSNSVDESLSKAIANTVLDESGNPSKVLPEMYYILNSLKECSDY